MSLLQNNLNNKTIQNIYHFRMVTVLVHTKSGLHRCE